MKAFLGWLFCALCFSISIQAADARSGRINWYTNYQEALNTAKSSGKPMAILFTGSDWCTWCHKLEQEALNTPDFAQALADRFVFVKLDFPLNSTLPPEVTAHNKQLQKKFNVQGYPTIIILDPQQERPIGTAGYRQGGGKQYAQFLLKLVDDHGVYKQQVKNLDNQPLSGADLKKLYHHAQQLGSFSEANQIMEVGVDSDCKRFFLLESYHHLVKNGQKDTPEAIEIRQNLLNDDPNNLNNTYYQVAIIDFESLSQAEQEPIERKVSSLVDYVRKFGEQDKENAWKLHMIISQVYFDNDRLSEALIYARSSLESAPLAAQSEIASAIQNIESQLSKK